MVPRAWVTVRLVKRLFRRREILLKVNGVIPGTSDGLFQTVTNGSPGTSMASMKYLPVVDRWAVVQFIRSITKNKIKDDRQSLKRLRRQLSKRKSR